MSCMLSRVFFFYVSGRLGGRTIVEGRYDVFGMKLVKNRGRGNAPRLDSSSRRKEPAIIKPKFPADGRPLQTDACPRTVVPGRLALAPRSH